MGGFEPLIGAVSVAALLGIAWLVVTIGERRRKGLQQRLATLAPGGSVSGSTASCCLGATAGTEAPFWAVETAFTVTGANSRIVEPVSGLSRRTSPSAPAAASTLPSGRNATV